MNISDALAADLVELSFDLDNPVGDLRADILQAGRDMRLAVRSYIGLTVTAVIDGYPVDFTVFDEGLDRPSASTSLMMPLSQLCDCDPASSIVFYARKPGAFVDFAADLSYALDLAPEMLVLDQHLDPPQGPSTLNHLTALNRAVGILLDRGHTPLDAHAELRRLARTTGQAMPDAARAVITAAGAGEHEPARGDDSR